MLVVEGLVKRFGGFTAVNNVSFRVEEGEILGRWANQGEPKLVGNVQKFGFFRPGARSGMDDSAGSKST